RAGDGGERTTAGLHVVGGALLDAREELARRVGLLGGELAIDRLALGEASAATRELEGTYRAAAVPRSPRPPADRREAQLFDLVVSERERTTIDERLRLDREELVHRPLRCACGDAGRLLAEDDDVVRMAGTCITDDELADRLARLLRRHDDR